MSKLNLMSAYIRNNNATYGGNVDVPSIYRRNNPYGLFHNKNGYEAYPMETADPASRPMHVGSKQDTIEFFLNNTNANALDVDGCTVRRDELAPTTLIFPLTA